MTVLIEFLMLWAVVWLVTFTLYIGFGSVFQWFAHRHPERRIQAGRRGEKRKWKEIRQSAWSLTATCFCLAGGLFGGLNTTVGTIDFESVNNVVLFLFAYVGGVTTLTGALIGGILFALLPLVQSESPSFAGLVFAAVAVAAMLLGKQPNGFAGLLSEPLQRWKRAMLVSQAERVGRSVPPPTKETAGV